MTHEHWLIVETRQWLTRAWEDLEAASRLLEGSRPLNPQAAFCAQQAAEKSLKGLLTFRKTRFGKTHDLRELGLQCTAGDGELTEATERVAPLSRFAVEGRYPGDWPTPTNEEAHKALQLARELYEMVLARPPNVAKPRP
jgi:HEPN domain-containing protein